MKLSHSLAQVLAVPQQPVIRWHSVGATPQINGPNDKKYYRKECDLPPNKINKRT